MVTADVFAHITHINNKIYLIFMKLKNIGQIKWISCKHCKKLKLSENVQFDKEFVKFYFVALLLYQSIIEYDDFFQNN